MKINSEFLSYLNKTVHTKIGNNQFTHREIFTIFHKFTFLQINETNGNKSVHLNNSVQVTSKIDF